MPWLYYERTDFDSIESLHDFNFKVSDSKRLYFKLAQYDIEGNLVHLHDMKDQLLLCERSIDDVEKINRFGTNFFKSCTVNLKTIVESNHETYFYELYLVNSTGKGNPNEALKYDDIPVAIKNYRAADGSFPNLDFSKTSELKYVKRFFLVDVISGITKTGGYKLKDTPDVK
jgi:hypothetical protein